MAESFSFPLHNPDVFFYESVDLLDRLINLSVDCGLLKRAPDRPQYNDLLLVMFKITALVAVNVKGLGDVFDLHYSTISPIATIG
jgi:hypothetical protein